MKSIRTRFAPSPTGYLHIGGLRTALYAYLFAKQNNGKFVLRIEDTDQSREVKGAVNSLIQTLNSLGLAYDEGPKLDNSKNIIQVGDSSPYFQSERLEIYNKYIQQLIAEGKAYYSFLTKEELSKIKLKLDKSNKALKRKDLNENYTEEELNTKIAQGEKYVVRIKTPESGEVVHNDIVRGKVVFDYSTIDDQIILKADGFPTYHFASVIDDALMEISHVIRGEEWLPSIPKHIFIYNALGFELPKFAHIPLILNPDKSKLSKRQGDVAVEDYLAKGYLPETLINFVALLGWNPGKGSTQEFFTVEELIKKFSLEQIHKGGAIFDTTKLDWMNGKYLRERIDIEKFLNLIFDDLKNNLDKLKCGKQFLEDKDKLNLFGELIRARIDRLDQVNDWFNENQWLDSVRKYDKKELAWKKSTFEDAIKKLSLILDFLKTQDKKFFNSVDSIESGIKNWIKENDFGVGDVLWPLRYAITGQEKSPNPFEIIYILGQEEVIERISNTL